MISERERERPKKACFCLGKEKKEWQRGPFSKWSAKAREIIEMRFAIKRK